MAGWMDSSDSRPRDTDSHGRTGALRAHCIYYKHGQYIYSLFVFLSESLCIKLPWMCTSCKVRLPRQEQRQGIPQTLPRARTSRRYPAPAEAIAGVPAAGAAPGPGLGQERTTPDQTRPPEAARGERPVRDPRNRAAAPSDDWRRAGGPAPPLT